MKGKQHTETLAALKRRLIPGCTIKLIDHYTFGRNIKADPRLDREAEVILWTSNDYTLRYEDGKTETLKWPLASTFQWIRENKFSVFENDQLKQWEIVKDSPGYVPREFPTSRL